MIGAAASIDVGAGLLDPDPKTMTINVVPSPDVNGDGLVNGLDISKTASEWGQTIDGRQMNGLVTAQIASFWLKTTDEIVSELNGRVDDGTVHALAAAQTPMQAAFSSGGVESHLSPIYPPAAQRGPA